MFIRRVPHKDSKNRKEYYTYKLVESYRTERGPRQRDILNLGVGFNLPKEQWKDLANCIEEIITGQKSFIDYPKAIRTPASMWVPLVKHFFQILLTSYFIPCNSIAGMVPVREWAPN